MNARRLPPLSGLVFVATVLVSVIGLGGNTPDSGASAAEVAAFYDGGIWRQAIAALLLAASIPFLIVFAVELAGAASRPAGPHSVWSYLLIGGGVLLGATLAMTAMLHFALADAGNNGFSPTVVQTLNVLDGDAWVAFNAGLGVTMLGAAGCLWSSAGAERWFARAALVLGVLLFIPFADFFALLLALIWIIVVSLMRSREPRSTRVMAPVSA